MGRALLVVCGRHWTSRQLPRATPLTRRGRTRLERDREEGRSAAKGDVDRALAPVLVAGRREGSHVLARAAL